MFLLATESCSDMDNNELDYNENEDSDDESSCRIFEKIWTKNA